MCKDDPVYFLENYVQIVHVDEGLVNFKMYDFQKKLIETITEHRNVIVKTGRQVGKTTTTIGWLLHYALFNKDKVVGILANKAITATRNIRKDSNILSASPKVSSARFKRME